ncbi:glycosyltransferase family 2 protein [Paenibacillus sp. PL2-23]|uniref:glycosyltransferase family 2 protein n=1 Tax=Paenibacillus sp. PL2-23 TaxID=2100729 RepID=UPI0030F92EBB
MKNVSVIMPTYNKADYLELTLASFCSQTNSNFEIVVINDGSTDESETVAKRYKNKLNLKYIKINNSGRSIARNKGIEASEGDVILFNDDDRIVSPSFIEEHNRSISEGGEKSIVIGWKHTLLTILKKNISIKQKDLLEIIKKNTDIIPKLYPESPIQLVFPEDLETFDYNKVSRFQMNDGHDNFPDYFRDYGKDLKNFHFKWLLGTTANMSLNKSFLLETGLFDERFKGWGMEDTELSYRLIDNGGELIFNPLAVNYHQTHPRGTWNDIVKNLRENTVYFCEKFMRLDTLLFYRWSKQDIQMKEANMLMDLATGNENVMRELHFIYSRFFQNNRES